MHILNSDVLDVLDIYDICIICREKNNLKIYTDQNKDCECNVKCCDGCFDLCKNLNYQCLIHGTKNKTTNIKNVEDIENIEDIVYYVMYNIENMLKFLIENKYLTVFFILTIFIGGFILMMLLMVLIIYQSIIFIKYLSDWIYQHIFIRFVF